MKQTAAVPEKMDPLTRIQEEIKEVVRREQEHKKFISGVVQHDDGNEIAQNIDNNEPLSIRSNHQDSSTDDELLLDENSNTTTMNKMYRNENHSDDSGISGASSPVNGTSTNSIKKINDDQKMSSHGLKLDLTNIATIPSTPCSATMTTTKEQRYIRPNCYNLTPEPPQQKLIKTLPSPHVNNIKNRKFNLGPAQKGLMQRFIASRGKLPLTNNDNNFPKSMLNDKSGIHHNNHIPRSKSPLFDAHNDHDFRSAPFILESTLSKPQVNIERDEEGRPIRPGYIPVELKIQRELKDLKSRESELKKMRKIQQSTPDILNALDNEDSDDDYTEHCFGPNKLRGTKSISELNDSTYYVNNFSSSHQLSEDVKNDLQFARNGSLKPAVSLAQLCDLDPQEAPSSHRLIAQWESLIQQNA